jgi:ketosteroid isomerase-like protein
MKRFIPLLMLSSLLFGQDFVNEGPVYEAQKKLLNNFVDAWLREDAKGCAELYENEAIYMIPGVPVLEGYSSILDSYKKQFSVPRDYEVTMEEPVVEVIAMDDWAMVRGVGNSMKITDEGSIARTYKWIILSRKQENDSWKIVWDIFNYDHPINGKN